MTALSKDIPYQVYAMFVEGFPQLIGVKEKDLEVDAEVKFPDDCPIITQLKLFNDRPQIPNLEYLEKRFCSLFSKNSKHSNHPNAFELQLRLQ